jgi:hypothetical protein
VFTARYALSPYIKQTSFVFKRLKKYVAKVYAVLKGPVDYVSLQAVVKQYWAVRFRTKWIWLPEQLSASWRTVQEMFPWRCSLDNAVGIATRLQTGRWGVRIPVVERDSLFSKTLPDRRSDLHSFLGNGHRGSLLRGKASGAWIWPLTSIYCGA